ncbi:MAG UNVERIFIED_CONTAM: PPC domain-containing protein [Planctomycetaceae bacterium]
MPFIVGELPEITEQEIEGRPIPAEVNLPVTINGRIYPREDIDIWTFTAEAGEVISCEVAAQQLKSPLDATMQVTGPTGTVIARCDDASGRDPQLAFTAPESGQYAVHLRDADLGGLQHYIYRLTLQRGPVVQAVYPLGARAGTHVSVELIGTGLPRHRGSSRFRPAAVQSSGSRPQRTCHLKFRNCRKSLNESLTTIRSPACPPRSAPF